MSQANICCPQFYPELWDSAPREWVDKLFIKDTIPQLFHIPLPWMVGKKIGKMWERVEAAQAAPEMKDFLLLAYDPSPWKSEFYMTVTQEVPDTENVKLSGSFETMVFDGPYHAVPKWIKTMDEALSAKGQKAEKYYISYMYCPQCAKKYGHNYVVLFAKVG